MDICESIYCSDVSQAKQVSKTSKTANGLAIFTMPVDSFILSVVILVEFSYDTKVVTFL